MGKKIRRHPISQLQVQYIKKKLNKAKNPKLLIDKIILQMCKNALANDHPLFWECKIHNDNYIIQFIEIIHLLQAKEVKNIKIFWEKFNFLLCRGNGRKVFTVYTGKDKVVEDVTAMLQDAVLQLKEKGRSNENN